MQTQMWEYMMYKHKPFIAENSKNWKGHGENETSTVGNCKQSPHAFYDAYSKVLKAAWEKFRISQLGMQTWEKTFQNSPWHYAKKCCSGYTAHPVPGFTAETTYSYFQESTSSINNVHIAIHALTNNGEFINFDLFVATPKIIKSVLKKQPSNSSPEEDGITYRYLPSTHHFWI